MGLTPVAYAEGIEITRATGDTVSIHIASPGKQEIDNTKSLQKALGSGHPTLAFVYYSVACSCTAGHCAIAEAALDSIVNENGRKDKINVLKIDGYTDESADSVFSVGVVPLIVYYDKNGKETRRVEWEISRQMIEDMLAGRVPPPGKLE
jgi:hypothetical protein